MTMLKTKDLFKPDPRNQPFNLTEDDLLDYVSRIEISKKVPKKIAEMLDFTRRMILYGYYNYDFFTQAAIHLFLVAESAVKERIYEELPEKCPMTKDDKTEIINKDFNVIFQRLREGWQIVGFEKLSRSLGSIVRVLKDEGVLPKRIGEPEIEIMRQLRNSAVDVTRAEPYSPAVVIPIYWEIVDFINCLYDKNYHESEPKVLKQLREHYLMLSQAVEKIKKTKKGGG
jgi:hypothetical protein